MTGSFLIGEQISVGEQIHRRDNVNAPPQVNLRRQKFGAAPALGDDISARVDDLRNARTVCEDDEDLIFNGASLREYATRRQTLETPGGGHENNFGTRERNLSDEFGEAQVVTNRDAALDAVEFNRHEFVARAENVALVREAEQMRFVVGRDEFTATIGDETAVENFAAARDDD